MNPQDGLYTLLIRGPEGTEARVIGSIARVIAAAREPGAVLAAMSDPATRIVSLTVTEKAYGIDRAGGILPDHPAIAPDLRSPREPKGAIGLLVEALRQRREQGLDPFTVLSCDNLPENGALLRAGVLDFAARADPALAPWIEAGVAFLDHGGPHHAGGDARHARRRRPAHRLRGPGRHRDRALQPVGHRGPVHRRPPGLGGGRGDLCRRCRSV
ncbi:MAG: hypothetical protein R3C69_04150 [Geminicoccaceae bacterium]